MSKALSTLTEAQKTVIRGCGFGAFLDMKSPVVRSTTLGYLIHNVDTETGSITFHGWTFKLTADLFELIMGVGDGGEEVAPYDDADVSPIREAILGGNFRIHVVNLVKQIKDSKDTDDLFVIRVVLLTLGTVLVPTSGEFVNQEYISVLLDVRKIGKRNWASFALDFLLEQIQRFRKRESKYMPGCTMFLQVSPND